MVNILLWISIFVLFIISLAGVVIPMVPDTIPLWLAFFIGAFLLTPSPTLPRSFWLGMTVISSFILISDYALGALFVNQFGRSRLVQIAAVVGLLLGPFLLGPAGLIVVPFLLVFIVGLLEKRGAWLLNLKRASAVLLSFFSSSLLKISFQVIMFSWFLWLVL